jgi:hypothetical protein
MDASRLTDARPISCDAADIAIKMTYFFIPPGKSGAVVID